MKLAGTRMAILSAVVQHAEPSARPPKHLPAGARRKAAQARPWTGLVIGAQRPVHDAIARWMVDGAELLLKIAEGARGGYRIDRSAQPGGTQSRGEPT